MKSHTRYTVDTDTGLGDLAQVVDDLPSKHKARGLVLTWGWRESRLRCMVNV